MNARLLSLLLPALTATSTPAGEAPPSDSKLAQVATIPSPSSPWRVGAGYTQLLGLKTRFTGLGTFHSPYQAQPPAGGVNYDYDNGFVHVDSSGNLGAQTWNWAYQNSSQYHPAGSGAMDFSLTNSLANGNAEENGGANPGVELFARYDMGEIGIAALKDRKASWGFRCGIHYSHVNVANKDLVATDLATTTDRFELGGTSPPSAPYMGSFDGPGPLLGDQPTRSTVIGGSGMVSGSRELDVHLMIANIGTYLEVPVAREFAVTLEAGISLGIGTGSYDFHSTTTVSGLGSEQSSGDESRACFLPGVYLGLVGTYELTKNWAIQCSGRYAYMDSFDVGANGSKASLSFDSAFVVSLGCIYTF